MFSVRQVSDWLRSRDMETSGTLDLGQERAKLTKLQAQKATLELEISRGNLIPMDLVVETWQGHIGNARAKLLAMPAKAAAQTIGMDEYLESEEFLTVLINEALDELDNDGLPKQHVKSREALAENMESAADANGSPMGRRKPETIARVERGAREVANQPGRVSARNYGHRGRCQNRNDCDYVQRPGG